MTGYAEVEWSTARVETMRLLLRPLRPRDLDELRLVDEDRRFRLWAAATDDRETSWMRTAVTERYTGRLLGAADLCVDPWRSAATARLEVSIAATARRRGYGGEVVRTLSAWAFRHESLPSDQTSCLRPLRYSGLSADHIQRTIRI